VKRYRDATWRLAQAGETGELRRVAGLLDDYDRHRARAFAYALEGDVDAALGELNEGWTVDWPFPAAYAADTARVRHLAGDQEGALVALGLAVHGADPLDPAIAELAAAIAARSPSLRLRAIGITLRGGSPWQRLRNAALAATSRDR
jgi:hypothetical protein